MTLEIGYHLSCEEHHPRSLIDIAPVAESAGFRFLTLSDHFHPWTSQQGHSPFVWHLIGAVGAVTSDIEIGTAVTCPIGRIHPVIVAHAAATAAAALPGRFFLGLGTGEYLNEHILGDDWPTAPHRLEKLEEAIHIIRELWGGGQQSIDGRFFTVRRTELFTLPDQPPAVIVAAAGKRSAELAGRVADGVMAVTAAKSTVDSYRSAAADDGTVYGKLTVCWAEDESQARQTVHRWWPTGAFPPKLLTDLETTKHFQELADLITEERASSEVTIGPDPEPYAAALQKFAENGFGRVTIHQVGPDQKGFIDFFTSQVQPQLSL